MNTKPKGSITGETRDQILEELCSRKATTLLATPYLSFESRFLEREGDRLHIRATMGREVALNTLSKHPLRLRFPWDLSFYSGPTRILSYEQGEHRRYLVVEVPETLGVDELRRAYREERMGKSMGALASSTLSSVAIQAFSLENLSIHGAGIFLKDYRNNDSWMPGTTAQISIELDNGPCISTSARICHSNGPYLGVEFQPPLGEVALGLAHPWIETRRAEAQRRWDDRAQIRAQAWEAVQPKAQPAGILLLSSDPLFASQVETGLAGAHALRVVPAVMAPYKSALSQPPLLLLLDTAGMGGEERRRAKALLEAQAPACPVLVLGRDPENEHPRTLALELKHASYLEWNASKGASLRILTQGLIRKHWKAE